PETGRYFRRVADLGKGQYSTVEASGGVAEDRTPWDDKLAMLNKKLVGTTVAFGSGSARHAVAAKMEAAIAAPVAVAADRAAFLGRSGKAVGGEGDLL